MTINTIRIAFVSMPNYINLFMHSWLKIQNDLARFLVFYCYFYIK